MTKVFFLQAISLPYSHQDNEIGENKGRNIQRDPYNGENKNSSNNGNS